MAGIIYLQARLGRNGRNNLFTSEAGIIYLLQARNTSEARVGGKARAKPLARRSLYYKRGSQGWSFPFRRLVVPQMNPTNPVVQRISRKDHNLKERPHRDNKT